MPPQASIHIFISWDVPLAPPSILDMESSGLTDSATAILLAVVTE